MTSRQCVNCFNVTLINKQLTGELYYISKMTYRA